MKLQINGNLDRGLNTLYNVTRKRILQVRLSQTYHFTLVCTVIEITK